jgi:superfamily I DNA and RNA helicase
LDIFRKLSFNKKEEFIDDKLFNQLMCIIYEPSADSSFIKKNDSSEFSIDIEVNKHKLKTHKLIIETLDNEQKSYNKFVLNGGYRFIRGIAGSGKTLIVVLAIKKLIKDYEKQRLFDIPKPKILILFYTSTLKKYYANVLKEIRGQVDIFTFWDFLNKKFNLSIDNFGRDDDGNIKIGEAALSKVTHSQLLNHYDYIFIDEAQDFYESWGALVYQMCVGSDSKEKNVVAVFDSRQDIYGNGNKDIYKSFKTEEEVKLTGRTKILTKCYRNTKPIFELAQLFTNESEDNIDFSIEDGILPTIEEIRDEHHFIRFINQLIKHNHSNVSLNDICVIYPSWHIRSSHIESIISKLPTDLAQLYSTKRESNFSFKHKSIKFISSNLAKGLEFPLVILYGFDKIPNDNSKINNLYYTAITRAQFELIITYQTLTPQIQAIQNHLQKLKETYAN